MLKTRASGKNNAPAPITPLQATFITESQPVHEVPYRRAQDLFHAGHQSVNLFPRQDGLIEYEQGVAGVGVTPNGEMVLISTTDSSHITLEHRFYTKEHGIMDVPESMMQVPEAQRIVGQDILHNGSVYLGRFVEEQDLGNGESNYSHILGVTATSPKPSWPVGKLLDDFSEFHRQDLLDSGILIRHGQNLWASKDMVFFAEKETHYTWKCQNVPTVNEKGEQLYTLSTLAAPRKGWDAAALYHEHFESHKAGFLSAASHHVMRPLIRAISEEQTGLTMAQAEVEVERRFGPMAKQFRKGHTLAEIRTQEQDRGKTGLGWVRGKLKSIFTTAVFGLNEIKKIDLLTGVVMPGALAYVSPLLLEGEGSALMVGAGLAACAALARFGFLWLSRSHPVFKDRHVIRNLWPEGIKARNIPHQFEMVRPDVLRNLRIMTSREVDIIARMPSNRAAKRPDWDILYLLGMLHGPYGSIGRTHKVGNHTVVHMAENKQSSGMAIEYWPMHEIAFAKNPDSPHLPKTIAESFAKAGKPIRMIRVVRGPDGLSCGHEDRFLTQDEYVREITRLQAQAAREPYTLSEKTGRYLQGYPFAKAVVEGGDGEGPGGPEKENEWDQDSRASGIAEIACKLAEVVIKRGVP